MCALLRKGDIEQIRVCQSLLWCLYFFNTQHIWYYIWHSMSAFEKMHGLLFENEIPSIIVHKLHCYYHLPSEYSGNAILSIRTVRFRSRTSVFAVLVACAFAMIRCRFAERRPRAFSFLTFRRRARFRWRISFSLYTLTLSSSLMNTVRRILLIFPILDKNTGTELVEF